MGTKVWKRRRKKKKKKDNRSPIACLVLPLESSIALLLAVLAG